MRKQNSNFDRNYLIIAVIIIIAILGYFIWESVRSDYRNILDHHYEMIERVNQLNQSQDSLNFSNHETR